MRPLQPSRAARACLALATSAAPQPSGGDLFVGQRFRHEAKESQLLVI